MEKQEQALNLQIEKLNLFQKKNLILNESIKVVKESCLAELDAIALPIQEIHIKHTDVLGSMVQKYSETDYTKVNQATEKTEKYLEEMKKLSDQKMWKVLNDKNDVLQAQIRLKSAKIEKRKLEKRNLITYLEEFALKSKK